MEPEEREMLERTLELAEDNNRMLRKMERAARWNLVFKAVYWAVVVGAAIGLYYYIQPYVDTLMDIYRAAGSIIGSPVGS